MVGSSANANNEQRFSKTSAQNNRMVGVVINRQAPKVRSSPQRASLFSDTIPNISRSGERSVEERVDFRLADYGTAKIWRGNY